jgi:hypothetical protein
MPRCPKDSGSSQSSFLLSPSSLSPMAAGRYARAMPTSLRCRLPGIAPRSRSPHRRGALQRGRNAHYPNRPVSKVVVPTHAGDDSDGKIWGIEGINILLILAGLILSVGLSMMLFRQQAHSPFVSVGIGSLPLVLMVAYVFGLRRGKPRHYDTDLLETFTSGTAWMAARRQPRHPVYPL